MVHSTISQTIEDVPPATYILQAQELVSRTTAVSLTFTVSAEQAFDHDDSTSATWRERKGQPYYTLTDLLYLGVRAFQLDIHYIVALGGFESPDRFRVCRSVNELDVEAVCSGDLNSELNISESPETCDAEGITLYPFHEGCPTNSPLLTDVFNIFKEFLEENPTLITIRVHDYTSGKFAGGFGSVKDEFDSLIEDTIGDMVFRNSGQNYVEADDWPTVDEILLPGARIIMFR